jgi:hypothetical protein
VHVGGHDERSFLSPVGWLKGTRTGVLVSFHLT